MKFVHIADMHFDTPFTGLNNLGDIRRLEQRKVFKKVIEYIKENEVEYLFIAGDVYDNDYVKKSTIEYINNLFKEIPNTKVFITPGNHDPYTKNSYYSTYEFNDNVYIFKGSIEKCEDEFVNIYGMGFNDFHLENSQLENMQIDNSSKPNILIIHCDLNGSKDEFGFSYNPILESKLKTLKFDYVAMGHIHKCNIGNGGNIIYPGSPISFGFDELGEHGMVVGELTKGKLEIEFIRLDERIFTEIEVNVESFNSKEDLIENISSLKLSDQNLYKIILAGVRNFEINTKELFNMISNDNILKVKDNTKLCYDIESLAKENNLKGIYITEVLKKLEDGIYTKEEVEKAIEIGLEVMK